MPMQLYRMIYYFSLANEKFFYYISWTAYQPESERLEEEIKYPGKFRFV